MGDMTTNQMFEALSVLCPDACLKMTAAGMWFVSMPGIKICGDGFLRGVGQFCSTPEGAIKLAFTAISDLPDEGEYLVVDAMKPTRRHVIWDRFMWRDIPVSSNP